jgi:hypothetical protein
MVTIAVPVAPAAALAQGGVSLPVLNGTVNVVG